MRDPVERQGAAIIVDGVPCPNPTSTPSLLQGLLVGEFLSRHVRSRERRVLDLGAGNQPYRRFFEAVADHYVAVDPTPVPGLGALALSEHLPFATSTFDLVVATEVLEHVDSLDETMAEIARIVRPGARLLVTVPFLYPIHEAPHDHRRFTHYGLRAQMERHGFEVHDLESHGGAPTLAMIVVTSVVFRLLRLAGGRMALVDRLQRRIAWRAELALLRAVRSGRIGRRNAMGPVSYGYSVEAVRPATVRPHHRSAAAASKSPK